VKQRVFATDERDLQVWNMITDMPKVSKPWAAVILLLNVGVPGKYKRGDSRI
jgi:hypothetical protein